MLAKKSSPASQCESQQSTDICEDISLGGSDVLSTTRGTPPGKSFITRKNGENGPAGANTGGNIFNPAARVFRAVRHVHQTADKFRFQILIEEVQIRLPYEANAAVEWIRGTRRARTKETRELSAKTGSQCSWSSADPLALIVTLFRAGNASTTAGDVSPRGTSRGSATSVLQKIRLRTFTPGDTPGTATSMGGNKEVSPYTYHPKEATLQVIDFSGGGKSDRIGVPVVVGHCRFCLAQYATAIFPAYERVTLNLTKCLDHQATITFLISCTSIAPEGCPAASTFGLKSLKSFDFSNALRRSYSSFSNLSNTSDTSTHRKHTAQSVDDRSEATTAADGSDAKPFRTASFGGNPCMPSEAASTTTSPHLLYTDAGDINRARRSSRDSSLKQVPPRARTRVATSSASKNDPIPDVFQTLPRNPSSDFQDTEYFPLITSSTSSHVVDTPSLENEVKSESHASTRAVGTNDLSKAPQTGAALLCRECRTCKAPGLPFLVDRVTELEEILIDKENALMQLKDKERAEIKRFEEAALNDRLAAEATAQQLRANLAERDSQVARLLKQLEALHEALKRAQRQHELSTEQLESNIKRAQRVGGTKSPTVDASLMEEIKMLKRRLDEASKQQTAYHQALDIERAKRSKLLAEYEARRLEDRKAFNFEKSSLESKLSTANDTVKQLQMDKKSSIAYQQHAELRISGLRQQLCNTSDSPDMSVTLAVTQKELQEALSSRDALQQTFFASERKLQQQLQMLMTTAQQRQAEAETQRQHFDTERRTLRNRIVELEQEMSALPRPSIVQRLNAQLNTASLQLQLLEPAGNSRQRSIPAASEHESGANNNRRENVDSSVTGMLSPTSDGTGWQYEGVDKGGRGLYDPRTAVGLAQRLIELEDELIKSKVAFAESETLRDQQLDKLRKKNAVLSEQTKEYSMLVSDLEVQITDLKLKKLRSSASKSHLQGLRSFAKSALKPGGNDKTVSFEDLGTAAAGDCGGVAGGGGIAGESGTAGGGGIAGGGAGDASDTAPVESRDHHEVDDEGRSRRRHKTVNTLLLAKGRDHSETDPGNRPAAVAGGDLRTECRRRCNTIVGEVSKGSGSKKSLMNDRSGDKRQPLDRRPTGLRPATGEGPRCRRRLSLAGEAKKESKDARDSSAHMYGRPLVK